MKVIQRIGQLGSLHLADLALLLFACYSLSYMYCTLEINAVGLINSGLRSTVLGSAVLLLFFPLSLSLWLSVSLCLSLCLHHSAVGVDEQVHQRLYQPEDTVDTTSALHCSKGWRLSVLFMLLITKIFPHWKCLFVLLLYYSPSSTHVIKLIFGGWQKPRASHAHDQEHNLFLIRQTNMFVCVTTNFLCRLINKRKQHYSSL